MAPLRIAYVIQNAGNDLAEDVGQAILIKQTVRGLQEAGQAITVFRLQGARVARMDDVFHLEEARATPLGISRTRPFRMAEGAIRRVQRELRLPYLAVFDAFRFYEACSRFLPEFDVCHEYGGLFSIGAALACRRRGIPYVLTAEADPFLENEIKGTPLRGLRALEAARRARAAYQLADRIITVSQAAKQRLVDAWNVAPEKIDVLPNGVDADLFHPAHDGEAIRQQWGLDGEPVVSFIGSFQAWHGLDNLVASFAQVVEEVPGCRLLLVGDGPGRPALEQKIREAGLGAAVTMTGLVPQTQVPAILAATDIAVLPYPQLPSELWFSPLKLYEYMAAGKAIVASRAGQIAEILEDGTNGILVPPGDVAALGDAISRLIREPAERARLGQNARQQAAEQHSWKQYAARLVEIYRVLHDLSGQ
jgi:glycosyltransferase involved in cell wall biosynthesis